MKKLNNLQNEIDKKFKKNKPASLEKRQKIKKYVTGGFETEIEYLGLSIPELRSFFKKEINYEVLTIHQQFLIFQQNWFQANSWEQKALSLFWLETLSSENLLKIGKKLLTWSKIIDNWAHSDSLCSTYAKIFELDPNLFMSTYQKWNTHSNPWFRRISMVGLLYYSRSRKKVPEFKFVSEFVENNLRHNHYYVQKAVGWTLRELYNVYPTETLSFLTKNILNISSVAWVASSEKLDIKTKKQLLILRRSK